MNETLRKQIDDELPSILKQAKATLAVNKMMRTSGERMNLPLEGRNVEIVYYRSDRENAPLIIGYHSGGWLFGGCALNDKMWSYIRDELHVNIASVGYRMAPKYKWKDSLADAYDSAMYIVGHADNFAFDTENVSLMGMSAGGNMAAAVCIKALGEGIMPFKHNLLLYPLLDVATEPEEKGPEHYGGPSAYMMNEQHISPEEAHDPLASPVFASADELKGFPSTLLMAAEHDVLKREGKKFTEMLESAGGQARFIEVKDMAHCYFELGFRNKLTPFEIEFIGEKGVAAFESKAMEREAINTCKIIKEELKI